MALWLVLGCIVLIICMGTYNSMRDEKNKYKSLERVAAMLLLSRDKEEIRKFALAKVDYLTDDSYQKLLCRIEELNADDILAGEPLKKRIEALDSESESEPEPIWPAYRRRGTKKS